MKTSINFCRKTAFSSRPRSTACSVLAIAFITTAAILTIGAFGTTRAFAVPAPSPIGERTNLDVFALNTGSQALEKIGGNDWLVAGPGYNLVRTFTNSANQKFLFLLNGNTGAAATFKLKADGSPGNPAWETGLQALPELRCTAADIVRLNEINKLITHDSFTGKIHTFALNEDGSLNALSMTVKTLPEMKDKNLFQVYYHSFYGYQMIGVDTWTGDAVVFWLDMQKTAEKAWTRGWTSIDNLYTGGVTYRLLYKAAGDPYKQPNESDDEAGRFVIEKVAQNGVDAQTIQDIGKSLEFTSVRFVQLPAVARQANTHGILFYRRTTGQYELYEFNPQAGLGSLLSAGKITADNETPPYIDVTPYFLNGKTCLAFVNADNATPVSYAQAEKMARVIHQGLDNTSVGYQFMLAQSGRVIFRRGYGKAKLDKNPATEIDMTTHTQLDIGSVGKMVTAITVLKLAEQGQVDLNLPISNYLVAGQASSRSWARKTPVLNLLTHTTGMNDKNKVCDVDLTTLKTDCQKFFNDKPNLPCGLDANGQYNCDREYNNENFIAARKVIEYVTGAQTSKDITKQTHELWATSVELDQMTCQVPAESYYYGPCNGVAGCLNYAGKIWRRELLSTDADNWLAHCSSGSWEASARELIAFLGALRYGKIIKNQALTDLLLSTNLKDFSGGPAALSWDWAADVYGETIASKGGYIPFNGVASRTLFTRLPNNCDGVLMLNTEPDVPLGNLLQDGYSFGVEGSAVLRSNGTYESSAPGRLAVDGVAINTTKPGLSTESHHVVAVRDSNGGLALKAFRASHDVAGNLIFMGQKEANGLPAKASTDLAITDGKDFATATLGGAQSQLNVLTWQFDGSFLTKHTSAVGASATEVAATKVAATDAQVRIVTAIRNLDGKLQLDVWDSFNNASPQLSTLKLAATFTDEAASAIEIKNLSPNTEWGQPARFVTAVRNSENQLKVTVWTVGADGKITRQSGSTFGSILNLRSATAPQLIAIDTRGDGVTRFFNGTGFMTTSINSSQLLDVATWQVSEAGEISLVDNKATGKKVLTQSVSATVTAVTLTEDESNKLKLIKWDVDGAGKITRTWSFLPSSALVTRLASASNQVIAAQNEQGNLTIFNWKILE